MAGAGTVGKFLGNSVGEGAAFAAGLAVGPTLQPLLRALENETWSAYPDRPIDAQTLAQGVAQGHITEAAGAGEAALTGTSGARFAEMVTMAKTGPGEGVALTLWRRGLLDLAGVTVALERAGLEPQWIAALTTGGIDGHGLKNVPLDPSVIATAIVRGIMVAPFELPYAPNLTAGQVQSFPQSPLDAGTESALTGTDVARLFVQTAIAGRPMAPEEAAKASFRGIVDRSDYDRAIAEGDIRSEYRDAIYEYTRQIITAHDWVELNLRGYVTKAEMYAGTALHGMSQADSDRLFEVLGRPLAVHQITTGLARGGVFQPIPGEITDPYEAAVHEANIKPSYYDLAIANKYTLPSAFVLKALATAGDLTQAETETLLLETGWPPDLAAKVSAVWGASTTAPANKHVTSSTTTLVTAARKAYVGGAANEAQARAALTAAGVAAATQTSLIALWDAQRTLEALPAPTAP